MEDNLKQKMLDMLLGSLTDEAKKFAQEEIEKIIDSEFANENDYTDYAAIDKMLALLASISEVAEMFRTDVDTK